MGHEDIVQHPETFTVEHERRATLYQADGRPLVRTAGFTAPTIRATQTSGTIPQLAKGGKVISGKKGKGEKR